MPSFPDDVGGAEGEADEAEVTDGGDWKGAAEEADGALVSAAIPLCPRVANGDALTGNGPPLALFVLLGAEPAGWCPDLVGDAVAISSARVMYENTRFFAHGQQSDRTVLFPLR